MSQFETNGTLVGRFNPASHGVDDSRAADPSQLNAKEGKPAPAVPSPALAVLSLRLQGTFGPLAGAALDPLAPENELLFVLHGRRFIHPDTDLPFPYETIASAVSNGSDAVFCHRFQSTGDAGGHTYRIRTAVLGEMDGELVVAGSFGPEWPAREPHMEQVFETSVRTLRSCWKQSDDIVRYIQMVLGRGSRVVVVDQTTDQVIFDGPGGDGDAGVGYPDLTDSIQDLLTAGGQLRQYRLADTPLAIVAVAPSKRPSEPPRREFEDYAIHTVRNSLSAIASAATFLEDQLPDRTRDNLAEFTSLITNQALRINSLVDQVELLRSPSHPEPIRLGLGEAAADLEAKLTGAIENPVRQECLSGESDAFRFETCPRYWGALTAAVALLHRKNHGDSVRTRLGCRPGPLSDTAVIEITTEMSDAAQTTIVEPGIVDFIERAAERTGSKVTSDCDNSSLTTRIEIRRCNLTGEQ